MEYHSITKSNNRGHYSTHSTRPTKKLAMRFFGVKPRAKRDGGGSQQPQAPSSGGEVEARTDAVTGSREPQQPQAPERKGVRGLLKSPVAAAVVSPRSGGRRRASPTTPTESGPDASSHRNGGRAAATRQSPRQSPKPDNRLKATSPTGQQEPQRPATAGAGAAEAPEAKAPPTSILHKNTHFSPPSPPPPQYDMSVSPYAPGPAHAASRVRFMSAELSVASTEASGVHLMAGGPNSVASSSAMSSSEGNRENVFDRVLNMVMAEEHERLNAMGFSYTPDPRSDAAARMKSHRREAETMSKEEARRLSFVDAKAKAVVASVGNSESSDELGLVPPGRFERAPIDIDTGLEVGDPNEAPIDMDTGLEIAFGAGDDDEYQDLNDEGVDDGEWQRLQDRALADGVGGLGLQDGRRVRSYDNSRQQQAPHESQHSRNTSDPERFGLSKGAQAAGAGGDAPSGKKSPGARKGMGGKKVKNLWDKKNNSKQLESEEWVAFGGEASEGGQRRYDDLAAF